MNESNETIRRGLAALDVMPASDPDRVKLLNAIGLLLYLRYTETKTTTDLEEAIRVAQEILDATTEGHPNKEVWSNNLWNLLSDKYSRTGHMNDLDMAIQIAKQTVDIATQTHDNRAMWLNNFGVLLNKRYLRVGIRADHEEALRVSREAVRITPEDHPERGGRLNNLRVQLGHRYSATGEISCLEEAIRVAQDCVQATADGHPDRGGRLKSLGLLLDNRYYANGETADIETSVEVARDSVKTTPSDDPEFGERLNFLGAQLAKRYLRGGRVEDLDEAIRIMQEAIGTIPELGDQLKRAGWLNNLAICLGNRYSRIGAMEDLEKAIQASREAVAKTPEGEASLTSCLNNLGYLLRDRYIRVPRLTDLDEGITCIRKAIELTREGQAGQTAALCNNLGLALGERFPETKLETDIDEAIQAVQKAIDLTPRGLPESAKRLHNLASLFGTRYASTGSIDDLDRSVQMAQAAIDSSTDDSFDRGNYWNSLGIALSTRFLKAQAPTDIERAISCYQSALRMPNLSIITLIKAGKSLLACHGFASDWPQCYAVSKAVLDLIPRLTPRSLRTSDKQHLLAQIAGLASDAAAAALHTGKSPLVALQFLEQGRAVLTGSLEELQADLSDLQKKHERVAEQFIRLRDELEPPLVRTAVLTEESPQPWQARATRRYDAAKEFDRLLVEIRALPGFADFLLPLSDERIQAAAVCGPIAIINLSKYRCDAIIVERHRIRSLALPDLESDYVEKIARKGNLGRPDVLEWLWDVIVNPVLDALDFRQKPTAEAWPRMWWIPTGILSQFPLHAAGVLSEQNTNTTLDCVMSSYNLSIKAIVRGRQRIPASIPSDSARALLVAMRETPGGHSRLPFTTKEVSMLHGICKSMAIDPIEPRRYKQDVMALMPSCKIFHFSGHGNTNRVDPSRSQLLLEDWESDPLMVSTLMEMNLREHFPFLAYLSACSTGRIQDDRFADESIHLISACQLAGFRHVIGTLWEVNDETCVDMARLTYEGMRDKGMTDESVCWGLHMAARETRHRWVSQFAMSRGASKLAALNLSGREAGRSRDIGGDGQDDEEPLYWVPYVHFGV